MNKTPFIQVLLPLRLEWEPFYSVEEGLEVAVGDRVEVTLSGRRYIGVVSAVDVTPPPEIKTILPARPCPLPPVGAQELSFWRALSDYYLCETGELYKAAYPQQKLESEEVAARVQERLEKRLQALQQKELKARKDSTRAQYRLQIERIQAVLEGKEVLPDAGEINLSSWQEEAVEAIGKAFSQGKTVLLNAGVQRKAVYLELVRRTLAQGKSVLYLVPEIGLSRQLEEEVERVFPQMMPYHSALTIVQRRGVSEAVRSQHACFVLGTRSALFLPYRNLGLVVVDEEQDSSYKQDSPAPRYHARETAILLARAHGAHVLLGSATPSLESLYNAENGLFTRVELKEDLQNASTPETLLIHTGAEMRKNGVSGSFSLKLLSQMHSCLDAGDKVLLVCRSKAFIPDCVTELEAIFGAKARGIVTATPATVKAQPVGAFGLVAILHADGLLAKEDFRCDERAMQLLSQIKERCAPWGLLAIQTFEPGHPAFGPWNSQAVDRLLAERFQFGYPPYTRLVQVIIKDGSQKRLAFMSAEISRILRTALPKSVTLAGPYAPATGEKDVRLIRLSLPRDKSLVSRKRLIYSTVLAFEKARKYIGHLHLDVDPV